MSRGAACPDEPPTEANQYQTRCTASGPTPIQPDGTSGRASSPDVQKSPAWCMIRVKQALGVRVAAGRGAERKQARPVAAVAPDRELGAHDDAETVPQRVQSFDPGHVIHQAEGVAVDVEPAALQPRPRGTPVLASQCSNRA